MTGTLAKCRSCGARIKWIKTTKGKKMPVDPKPVSVYDLENDDILVFEDGEVRQVGKCGRLDFGYISHFSTCPGAYDWIKK